MENLNPPLLNAFFKNSIIKPNFNTFQRHLVSFCILTFANLYLYKFDLNFVIKYEAKNCFVFFVKSKCKMCYRKANLDFSVLKIKKI